MLTKSYSANRPAALWVHRVVPAQGCFHPRPSTCFDSPSLDIFYNVELIPSSASPPQSSFARAPRSVSPFGPSFTLPRVSCPLRDLTSAQPLFARAPSPRYGASSGFRSLSTLCSAPRLAGLFHPAATSRTRSFRGFSPRAATLPRRKEPAPRPLALAPLTRLRRLPSCAGLDFEAFIYARPRSLLRSYSPRREPLPSSSFSPPGLSFSYGEAPAYPEPSALDVHSLGLRLRARPKSSSPASSPRRTQRDRLRSRLPARDFEPTARILVFDSPRLAVARPTICFDHQRFRR